MARPAGGTIGLTVDERIGRRRDQGRWIIRLFVGNEQLDAE
jgi:hypothetical protein